MLVDVEKREFSNDFFSQQETKDTVKARTLQALPYSNYVLIMIILCLIFNIFCFSSDTSSVIFS